MRRQGARQMTSIQSTITQLELNRLPTTGISFSILLELQFPQTRIFSNIFLILKFQFSRHLYSASHPPHRNYQNRGNKKCSVFIVTVHYKDFRKNIGYFKFVFC